MEGLMKYYKLWMDKISGDLNSIFISLVKTTLSQLANRNNTSSISKEQS